MRLNTPAGAAPVENMREELARSLEIEERYEREKAEDQAEWDRYLRTGVSFSHEEVKAHLNALADEAAP